MPIALVTSNTFTFADGNAGHVCALGSAPSVGDLDVLCVNSNTVVTTPTGFTVGESFVNSQGSYLYYRKAVGGESANVTITTSGDHNTQVGWSRWSGSNAFDQHANSHADGSAGSTTPTATTPTLSATGELVVAFAALHSIQNPAPDTPVWSSGYTGLTSATIGLTGTGVVGFVGYKLLAGTASESPNVTWTRTADDRYMLVGTWTAAGGASARTSDFMAFF